MFCITTLGLTKAVVMPCTRTSKMQHLLKTLSLQPLYALWAQDPFTMTSILNKNANDNQGNCSNCSNDNWKLIPHVPAAGLGTYLTFIPGLCVWKFHYHSFTDEKLRGRKAKKSVQAAQQVVGGAWIQTHQHASGAQALTCGVSCLIQGLRSPPFVPPFSVVR